MPGGPTGRGCDACRAQKKKCDQKKPSCSRCEKLRIHCDGSGKQRFRFINHSGSTTSLAIRVATPVKGPSNEASRLCDATVAVLSQARGDLRFDVARAWGYFLTFLPKCIGRTLALDYAVPVFLAHHADYRQKFRGDSSDQLLRATRTIVLYNKALSKLYDALDDPDLCSRVETLLAVMVLSIIEGRVEGPISSWASAHAPGALSLMRLLNWPVYGRNDLETYLFDHLRTTIVAQSILNPVIVLSSEDYRKIEEPYLAGDRAEHQFVRCFVNVGETATLVRSALVWGQDIITVSARAQGLHRELLELRRFFRQRLYDFESNFALSQIAASKHGLYQLTYSSVLTFYGVLICMRRALDACDAVLDQDTAQLCTDALQLAEEGKIYRPLGSLWATRMLMTTWCATLDLEKRLEIEHIIRDYQKSQSLETDGALPKSDMEWMERRMRFDED